jgi:hypothetical protein
VQHIGVAKRALRIAAQTVDQQPEHAQPQHPNLLGMRNPPGLEFRTKGQIKVSRKPP